MLKFMFVGRRAAGRTRKGAIGHLRDIHGRMVVCPPVDAGAMPRNYVQNHVVDGAYPGVGQYAIERDLVTELWFDSIDHMRQSTCTPYYLANMKPDEPRFVDDASVAKMMVLPRTLIEDGAGVYKAFLFLSRGDAGDAAAWDAARVAIGTAFCATPGIAAAIENAVMAPPGGDRPFVDIVLEGWFAAREDAAPPVERFGDMIRSFGAAVDAGRSFAVLAEQYDTDRLRALHGCLVLSS